jgi:hypothetical protein
MVTVKEIATLEMSTRKIEETTLTAGESYRLIGICIELVDLCSKVTGRFDPAIGTMIAFARDEALTSAIVTYE